MIDWQMIDEISRFLVTVESAVYYAGHEESW